MTTITISEALKTDLERLRDDLELSSLDATINHVLDNPQRGSRALSGNDATLTEPVKVDGFTVERVKRLRETGNYSDYEAVIRDKAGIQPRDTGERPVDVRPL